MQHQLEAMVAGPGNACDGEAQQRSRSFHVGQDQQLGSETHQNQNQKEYLFEASAQEKAFQQGSHACGEEHIHGGECQRAGNNIWSRGGSVQTIA